MKYKSVKIKTKILNNNNMKIIFINKFRATIYAGACKIRLFHLENLVGETIEKWLNLMPNKDLFIHLICEEAPRHTLDIQKYLNEITN